MTAYLVLADIHGNLEALEAVFAHAQRHHGTPTEVWCLGDLVGYGPDPGPCIDLLREPPGFTGVPVRCVLGNHEEGVLLLQRGERLSQPSLDILQSWAWTLKVLTSAQLDYLQSLPHQLVLDSCPMPTLLVHGAPPDSLEQYLLTASDVEVHIRSLAQRLCLFGHTHLASYFEADATRFEARPRLFTTESTPTIVRAEKIFMNPGTVGQPRWGELVTWGVSERQGGYPRKLVGRPGASYLWIEMQPDELLVSFHLVAYDSHRTVQKMRGLGTRSPALIVPERYMRRITEGLR